MISASPSPVPAGRTPRTRSALAVAIPIFAAMPSLAACQPEGERGDVAVTVRFVHLNGPAGAGLKAYVIERINARGVITATPITDAAGEIRLEGSYCLPMIVVVEGAYAIIRPEGRGPLIVATIDAAAASQRRLDRTFGTPNPANFGWSARNRGCG